ncbi:integrase, catalytic region, zinc finger, CCHC-type containing protein [Tanacetum coccineum]|uniref:Integrase, catalytic region, zinc finger, CCHC-type containing protein n=1 Tax=Tanacetum coccineum TaxID=301880 RepID=A0ABQ5IP00_9ASTR
MTGDRSRLMNFVKKFIGTVRFGNDHFGAIMGYGDYVIGESVISRVYYVEGLGHNLFSVGQFCDSDLEVAFRKHSCYVRDTDGVELLKGSRGSNLYTISVEDMLKSSPICLLSKASRNKSCENLGKLQPTADIGIFVGSYIANVAAQYPGIPTGHLWLLLLMLDAPSWKSYIITTWIIITSIRTDSRPLITSLGIPQDRYPLGNSLLRMLCGASTIPYCPKSNRKNFQFAATEDCWFSKPCKKKVHEFGSTGNILRILAPLLSLEAIRNIHCQAAAKNMTVYQMDVKTAFLNGELKEKSCSTKPEACLTQNVTISLLSDEKHFKPVKQLPGHDNQSRPTTKQLECNKRSSRYHTKEPSIWSFAKFPSISLVQLRSSKKQTSTSISSTEAEYIAMSGCCAQILWMRSQIDRLIRLLLTIASHCTVKQECHSTFAANNVHTPDKIR